ncbi:MAG: hypothetical protein CMJ33_05030 [Phycisphaerae bacterium]|nr:hypothetical protein [Phycisphaerae bacterium]HAW96724.1 hypothetical protein [Phycisphaerales bacterium]
MAMKESRVRTAILFLLSVIAENALIMARALSCLELWKTPRRASTGSMAYRQVKDATDEVKDQPAHREPDQ